MLKRNFISLAYSRNSLSWVQCICGLFFSFETVDLSCLYGLSHLPVIYESRW